MNSKENKVTFLLKVPPPVHGSTLMNRYVANHVKRRNGNIVLEQSISGDTEKIGKVSLTKLWLVFRNYLVLITSILKSKPDLVYFALSPIGFAFLKDAVSVAIIKIFGIPIIYHLHGKGISKASVKLGLSNLYRFVFKNQYVITLSRYLNYDVEHFGVRKIYNIGNGIEDVKPKDFPKTSEEFVITYLSNYVKEKGILEFIELLAELKNRRELFKAQIIGKPIDLSEEELLSIINEKGLTDTIIHQGASYDDEKLKLLGNTSVFVFPTYYTNECYPLVLLEAKQFGLPIITSSEGGIRDIVKDGFNGFIIDPKNISIMADKVELIKNDSNLRKKISDLNRKEFLELHTISSFLSSVDNVIYEVLKEYG